MEFNIRAGSSDFIGPVHDFPGDDEVGPESYQSCIREGYISSVATIYGAAEKYGLDIDSETFERWKRVCAAAGIIDDFLDESRDRQQAAQLYMRGIAHLRGQAERPLMPDWADGNLETAIALLWNSTVGLPSGRRDKLLDAAVRIGEVSVSKSQCASSDEYTGLRREEGLCSAILIIETASDYVHAQPEFDRFAAWVGNAMETGTLVHGARKLRRDYESGLTMTPDSVINSLKIALEARHSAWRLISDRKDMLATRSALKTRKRSGFKSGGTRLF